MTVTPVPPLRPLAPPASDPNPVGGEQALVAAVELAAAYAADAAHTLQAAGLLELTPIELPPVVGSSEDQVLVRELAPLYLVAELDRAGILRSLESLAALYVSGGVRADLAEIGEELLALWRERNQRFSASERTAMFRRLFGSPGPELAGGSANDDFEVGMARLAEALISHDPSAASSSRAGLTAGATQLALNMVRHAQGVPRLASRDLVEMLRTALAILGDRRVLAALGQRSLWTLVRFFETQSGRSSELTAHVQRARSGVVVLGWLADHLVALQSGRRDEPPSAVVDAAFEWLEATLVIWDDAKR